MDKMYASSEHHLMTSSWLDEVSIAQGLAPPSSVHSSSVAEKMEDTPSFASSVSAGSKDEKKVVVHSGRFSAGDPRQGQGSSAALSGGSSITLQEGGSSDDQDSIGKGEEDVTAGGGGGGGSGGGGGGGGGGRDDNDGGGSDDSGTDNKSSSSSDGDVAKADIPDERPTMDPDGADDLGAKPRGKHTDQKEGAWDMDFTMNSLLEGKEDIPIGTLAVCLVAKP